MRRSNLRWLVVVVAAITAVATIAIYQLVASSPAGQLGPGHPFVTQLAHAQGKGKRKQLYTCGMHPQVIKDAPGTCPLCGMDLTPMKKGTAGGGASGKKKGPRKIKHWVSPMNPTYIRDKPGKSPMGMDLVPVYEGGDDGKTIAIDPVVVQNMGVRIATVRRGDLVHPVRAIGEVVVAEDLVSVVNLRFSGWIERLYVDQTGIKVRAGQPLFRVYSPELVSAQEEYLVALRATGKDSPLVRASRMKLKLFDLSDRAIRAIAKRGKARRTLTIYAPRSGYVLHKTVVQGARAIAGQDIFRIGKLSAIWVHVQVYEHDAPWIRLGQPATMELSFQLGKLYKGKVSYIYPTLDKHTRTLKVRLEFKNPTLMLKPGMFTTVRIDTQKKEGVLLVPTEAILHSGERQILFVALGMGKYEARELVTGVYGKGHLTEVKAGVKEGERVVVSGQFLLDSESQLREAVAKLLAARLQAKGKDGKLLMKPGTSTTPPAAGAKKTQPATGAMKTPPAPPPTGHEGHDHRVAGKPYTCPMHPQIREAKPGRCPICGMNLVKDDGKRGKKTRVEKSQGKKSKGKKAKGKKAKGKKAKDKKSKDKKSKGYTCSMHPQINKSKPGKCPICGMDLIKRKAK